MNPDLAQAQGQEGVTGGAQDQPQDGRSYGSQCPPEAQGGPAGSASTYARGGDAPFSFNAPPMSDEAPQPEGLAGPSSLAPPLDLERLERIAKAGDDDSPGGWTYGRAKVQRVGGGWVADTDSQDLAAYIAAFDPPTVLALIALARDRRAKAEEARCLQADLGAEVYHHGVAQAEAQRLREERDEAKQIANECLNRPIGQLVAERDRLRSALEEAEGALEHVELGQIDPGEIVRVRRDLARIRALRGESGEMLVSRPPPPETT